MLLKEVMKETGLIRKAIEYYEKEQFVYPKKLSNGYRDYDEECAQTLLYVKNLRLLSLNIEKINSIILHQEYAPQIYEQRIKLYIGDKDFT